MRVEGDNRHEESIVEETVTSDDVVTIDYESDRVRETIAEEKYYYC